MNISAQVNLGELVAAYPETSKYLFEEWGLHCVNCFANKFDTLEAGMRLHGYKDEHIAQAVNGLKRFLTKGNAN